MARVAATGSGSGVGQPTLRARSSVWVISSTIRVTRYSSSGRSNPPITTIRVVLGQRREARREPGDRRVELLDEGRGTDGGHGITPLPHARVQRVVDVGGERHHLVVLGRVGNHPSLLGDAGVQILHDGLHPADQMAREPADGEPGEHAVGVPRRRHLGCREHAPGLGSRAQERAPDVDPEHHASIPTSSSSRRPMTTRWIWLVPS